jgi:bisanhydrobacterioruberin hydratase
MNLSVILYLIFGFGILWHALPVTRDIVISLTPIALVIAYIIVLFPEAKGKNVNVIIWFALVSVITYLLEVIGVSTSLIFGEYMYGGSLGILVLGVPIIIGLNWSLIIWGSTEIASRLKVHTGVKVLIAAFLAVFLDFLIEPVAASLDYWKWQDNIIPFQNYAAWFVIALLFSFTYFLLKLKSRSNLPVHFFITQVLFFGSLYILKV